MQPHLGTRLTGLYLVPKLTTVASAAVQKFSKNLGPQTLGAIVELVRNLMAHAQKPHFVFRLNGRVHLNRRGSQFSRLLLAAEVCASALVMLDTLRPEVV